MIRYPKYIVKVTPVGGTVAWNSPHLSGDLVSIHVKPTTPGNKFRIQITDSEGVLIYKTNQLYRGELTQSYDGEVLDDILTFAISEAVIDEEFTVIIRLRVDIRNR